MLDLSAVLEPRWLRAAFDSALRQRASNVGWIRHALTHARGHRGAWRLRGIVLDYERDNQVSESVLESFLMELALFTGRVPQRQMKLTLPDGQRIRLDFAWPDLRFCLEVDSYEHHGLRNQFHKDRARDRGLMALGWVVQRYTWPEIFDDSRRVIHELSESLERRAAEMDRLLLRDGDGVEWTRWAA
jgi:very-short-patch-repair endonuclease